MSWNSMFTKKNLLVSGVCACPGIVAGRTYIWDNDVEQNLNEGDILLVLDLTDELPFWAIQKSSAIISCGHTSYSHLTSFAMALNKPYTLDETCRLMEQCDHLYSPDGIRSLTMKTAIGLLWATGLRTSELVNLTISDVDFTNNLLNVCSSKFNKDRIVPLLPEVSDQLRSYRSQVESICNKVRLGNEFFITTGGKPFKRNAFEYAFQTIRDIIDVSDSGYPHARLYDFRHTFATRTIKNWLEQGMDVNAKLFLLSTYMGHIHPEDTYWYLSSTPELMDIASRKYEDIYGGDAHE